MLVSSAGMLRAGRRKKYAVGAFDINNMEMLKAVMEACSEEKSPVIIQTTEKAIKYAGIQYLSSMIKAAARQKIPVALHLDHGRDLNMIRSCIGNGYTSVMFDGSKLPFDKNIQLTKQVVQMARPKKISVEAELGVILGKEDAVSSAESFCTDPAAARTFVRKTGIDSLAVAIGTKHGLSKEEIRKGMKKRNMALRFDILKEISGSVRVPLVLHGGSDVPPADIKKCIKLGVSKINIDTELRVAFTQSVNKFIKNNPSVYDPREMLQPAINAMKIVVKKKVKEFGCARKA